jgi:hypothetical protein
MAAFSRPIAVALARQRVCWTDIVEELLECATIQELSDFALSPMTSGNDLWNNEHKAIEES